MTSTMQTEDAGLEIPMVRPRNDYSYFPPVVVQEGRTSGEHPTRPFQANILNHSQNSNKDMDTTIQSQNRTDLETPIKCLSIDCSYVPLEVLQEISTSGEHEKPTTLSQAYNLKHSQSSDWDIESTFESQNLRDLEPPMKRPRIGSSDLIPAIEQEASAGRQDQDLATPFQAENLNHFQFTYKNIDTAIELQNLTGLRINCSDLIPAIALDASTSGHLSQSPTTPFQVDILSHSQTSNKDLGSTIELQNTAGLRIDFSDLTPAIAPDASTSGHQFPTTPSQADNLSHSQTSNKDLGSTIELQNTAGLRIDFSDLTPATAPDASTSGHQSPTTPFKNEIPDHSQTSTINTPIEVVRGFSCPLCPSTSFRQDQIKRLRCSHEFHQPCIDMWLCEHSNCPVCHTPYRRIGKHTKHKKPRRAGRHHAGSKNRAARRRELQIYLEL